MIDGYKNSEPRRIHCPGCRTKLTACILVNQNGIESPHVLAHFCTVQGCWRYTDLSINTGWKKI